MLPLQNLPSESWLFRISSGVKTEQDSSVEAAREAMKKVFSQLNEQVLQINCRVVKVECTVSKYRYDVASPAKDQFFQPKPVHATSTYMNICIYIYICI